MSPDQPIDLIQTAAIIAVFSVLVFVVTTLRRAIERGGKHLQQLLVEQREIRNLLNQHQRQIEGLKQRLDELKKEEV